jgi:hypothetical protein
MTARVIAIFGKCWSERTRRDVICLLKPLFSLPLEVAATFTEHRRIMNKLLTCALLLALPLALMAQTPAKVGVKPAAAGKSRLEVKSQANQMAAGMVAAEAALTPAELAIADQIYRGKLPCELGAFVNLQADAKSPGYFDVQLGKQKFRMFPVETSTGAIRLEDRKSGVVWLQLGNKSMLMSQKLGKRLADVCMNPDQVLVAQHMISNPVPSLLDAPVATVIK